MVPIDHDYVYAFRTLSDGLAKCKHQKARCARPNSSDFSNLRSKFIRIVK